VLLPLAKHSRNHAHHLCSSNRETHHKGLQQERSSSGSCVTTIVKEHQQKSNVCTQLPQLNMQDAAQAFRGPSPTVSANYPQSQEHNADA
jgi:hypothetical protein